MQVIIIQETADWFIVYNCRAIVWCIHFIKQMLIIMLTGKDTAPLANL